MDIYKKAFDLFLDSVHENVQDLRDKLAFADPEEKDYIEGRIFSYIEVEAIVRDIERQLGLNNLN